MNYFVWYEPDVQLTVIEKISGALDAYRNRFNIVPNLVLVNAANMAEVSGVEVRSVGTVQPNHFWVGHIDERGADNAAAEG